MYTTEALLRKAITIFVQCYIGYNDTEKALTNLNLLPSVEFCTGKSYPGCLIYIPNLSAQYLLETLLKLSCLHRYLKCQKLSEKVYKTNIAISDKKRERNPSLEIIRKCN